jgi:succinate dehydrogenase / fumarate reductase cytochrome b subunit
MNMPPTFARPVYLNPLKIRLPVTATVSLAHRISGIVLALCLPMLVFALSLSLNDGAAFERGLAAVRSLPGRLVLLLLAWALAHHTAAGVRHLLFDAGVGTRYRTARATAWTVHAVALAIALLAGAGLLGGVA